MGPRRLRAPAGAQLRRLGILVALFVLFAGAMPGLARGATVTVGFGPGSAPSEHGPPLLDAVLSYTAAPGEANDVSVSAVAHGLRIYDAGALITGDPAYCSNSDPHTIVCAVSADSNHEAGFGGASFSLGDGNDVFHGIDMHGYAGQATPTFFVDGGPGNDQLTAGAATGVKLTGGSGNDTVTGGPGDTIRGSPGQDVISGPGGTLDLSAARTAVTVDLKRGTVQAAGESDRVAGLKSVIGGAGNDTLIASDDTASLDGGPGHNTLIGGAGKTILDGSSAGNRILCGSGNNVVVDVTARDLVGPRCRTIEPAASTFGAAFDSRLPLRSRTGVVATVDQYVCADPPCTLTLRLVIARGSPRHRDAPAGLVLGERRVLLRRSGTVRNAGVKLSRRGIALLARDGSLRTTVSFSTHDAFGPPFDTGAYSIVLRRP